jgi:uncharacterized damage-inducible protein DinB
LEKIKTLSDEYRNEMEKFFQEEWPVLDYKKVTPWWMEGEFYKEEVLHHVLVHEIHHIGQLSVWARELNLEPVSANLLGRELY